ncbi:dihydrofolate reductase [Verrucomicrobium sp. BvORR034]|uniref:dihydrofolate reductase n=1 Tax=Verrucomicrobium sp. BvORR034 TaxID=1396418 RepID=UPI0007C7766A|nr:dihydrofolate reductase [Verrucomicrobium sp. BvORR034]
MKPELTLIAAVDENLLLATAQGIPWKLPDDVAHFRAYCAGKWLLLGRRTFEEMTGWFKPDQHPLVLTSACGYDPKPGSGVASVPQALALAEASGQEELVCIGGGQVFATAMANATRLVVTRIRHTFEPGDRPVYFPHISGDTWDEERRQEHPVDDRHAWPFAFVEYVRRAEKPQGA